MTRLALLVLIIVSGCEKPKLPPATAPTDIVHVTRTGKRYHRAGCIALLKSDAPVSLADARAKDLMSCPQCRP